MVIQLLAFMSLFVNILNLLPIIPMDGGMIFKEICCFVSPRGGLKFAFAWSFVLAALVTLFYLYVTLMKYNVAPKLFFYPFLFPELSLIIFGLMAYRCWASYRQLALKDRYMAYMQDDDMSGPRRPSYGVHEVPVKDPRDFAPPAPGSERPRD